MAYLHAMKHDEPIVKWPVILLGMSVAFSLFGDMAIYAILPVYHEVLGFGPMQVGILLSANRWVRIITNRGAGRVLERSDPSRVLAVVLFLGACAAAIYASTPPFLLFLAARILWGVCWSFIRHIGVMTSLGTVHEKRAAGILGIYNGVVQFGFIAGTLAAGLLFDSWGYRATFWLIAAMSLIGIPLDFAGFTRLRKHTSIRHHRAPTQNRFDRVMLLRGFIVSCVGTGLIISTLGFVLRQHFGEVFQVGSIVLGITTVNAVLIASHYTINSIGSPVLGRLIDAIGRSTSEFLAFTFGCAALTLAAIFTQPWVLIPAVVIFFVATVTGKLSLMSQAGLTGSKNFSLMMSASDMGSATGPIIGWAAIETSGSPEAIFTIGAALFAIAAVSELIKR